MPTWRLVVFTAFCLSATYGFAFGQNSGFTYDPHSGNSYDWFSGPSGTNVYGFNSQTGSTWNTLIDRQNNMRGFDSNGNSWMYDDTSKIYQNFGTGKTCTGTGVYRTCW